MKYFDFKMLEKHAHEGKENLEEWALFFILLFLGYIIAKMFVYWDR